VQVVAAFLAGLPAFDSERGLFCRDGDFFRSKAGKRKRNKVLAFAGALDMNGG
jgi:hypothetical protein